MITKLILFCFSIAPICLCLRPNHTLNLETASESGLTTIEWLSIRNRKATFAASDEMVRVVCYEADNRPVISFLWMSSCFNMQLEDSYRIFNGRNATDAYDNYRFNVFSLQRLLFGDFSWMCFKPFNDFCVVVDTAGSFDVSLEIEDMDSRYMEAFLLALALYIIADFLTKSNLVQLLLGTLCGVIFFSFFLCYVITRTFPHKPQWAIFAFLCSSGSITVFLRWIYNSATDKSVLPLICWYLLITGVVSFVACYLAGPIENHRVQNVCRWLIQAVCIMVIYHCLPSHIIALFFSCTLVFMSICAHFALPAYRNYQRVIRG